MSSESDAEALGQHLQRAVEEIEKDLRGFKEVAEHLQGDEGKLNEVSEAIANGSGGLKNSARQYANLMDDVATDLQFVIQEIEGIEGNIREVREALIQERCSNRKPLIRNFSFIRN